MKTEINGELVKWLNNKWIQARKDSRKSLFVNYDFEPIDFKEIKVNPEKEQIQRQISLSTTKDLQRKTSNFC